MEKPFIRLVDSNGKIKSKKLQWETLENVLKLYKSPKIKQVEKTSELDLSNCKLVDIIWDLKCLQLKKLNLSHNELTKVPRCFYLGLELLEFLDLSYNKISNFDIEPNCCQTLKKLNLASNNLKDIPQWIMNHRAIHLEELCYDFNKITELRCIFGVTKNFWVSKLSLRNCLVNDNDFNFLKNCRYLEELDLSNETGKRNCNQISNPDKLLYQPQWKNLRVLKLNHLWLTMFPEGLFWLEGLMELHLTHNHLMWLPTNGLEYFVNLEILNVSHNSISSLPDKLEWLVDLKTLNLSYNTLEMVCDFSKMKGLEILDLYSNKLEYLDHEFVGCNIVGMDVEMNYFDSNLWNFPSYQEIKNKLRSLTEEERRDDFVEVASESSRSISCSSSEVSVLEDWDEEIKLQEQITASDNEWIGDSPPLPQIPTRYYEKPTVYNDDVIFCDAD